MMWVRGCASSLRKKPVSFCSVPPEVFSMVMWDEEERIMRTFLESDIVAVGFELVVVVMDGGMICN